MHLASTRRPAQLLRRQVSARVPWLATVGWVWMCLAATAWAQGYQEEAEPKTYVPSYMIIIFAVGFALLMICRSGKRSTSFRREE